MCAEKEAPQSGIYFSSHGLRYNPCVAGQTVSAVLIARCAIIIPYFYYESLIICLFREILNSPITIYIYLLEMSGRSRGILRLLTVINISKCKRFYISLTA